MVRVSTKSSGARPVTKYCGVSIPQVTPKRAPSAARRSCTGEVLSGRPAGNSSFGYEMTKRRA